LPNGFAICDPLCGIPRKTFRKVCSKRDGARNGMPTPAHPRPPSPYGATGGEGRGRPGPVLEAPGVGLHGVRVPPRGVVPVARLLPIHRSSHIAMDPLPTLRRDVSPKAAGRTAAQSTVIIRSKENKKNWMEFGIFWCRKKIPGKKIRVKPQKNHVIKASKKLSDGDVANAGRKVSFTNGS